MVELDAKAFGETGNGTLDGYASVKNSLDSYGDTIIDGAYMNLEQLVKNGFVTFGHANHEQPVGYITEAKEDSKGLYVKMEFHGTEEAQQVRTVCLERIAAGKSVGLSIDFYTHEKEYKDDGSGSGNQIRVLKKIEVVGFAIVNVPAERRAGATGAKSGTGSRLEDQYIGLLDELEDWTGRMESLAADRKQGLTEPKAKMLEEVRSRLDDLIGVSAAPSDQKADDTPLGAILELEQFAATL